MVLLEEGAVTFSVRHLGPGERFIVKTDDAEDIRTKTERLNAAFHKVSEAMYERAQAQQTASGNGATERYIRDINERIRLIRIHDFTTPDRIEATIEEHLEILETVRAGRADAAAALMRVHIERSAEVVERRVGDLLARMFEEERQ